MSTFRRAKHKESGSHIRLFNRCPLARRRKRRDIFAIGEYPACTSKQKSTALAVLFCLEMKRADAHEKLGGTNERLLKYYRENIDNYIKDVI